MLSAAMGIVGVADSLPTVALKLIWRGGDWCFHCLVLWIKG